MLSRVIVCGASQESGASWTSMNVRRIRACMEASVLGQSIAINAAALKDGVAQNVQRTSMSASPIHASTAVSVWTRLGHMDATARVDGWAHHVRSQYRRVQPR